MKKIFTLAITLLLGAAPLAAAGPAASHRNVPAQSVSRQISTRTPQQPFADDSWKALGMGKFCDPVMTNMFDDYLIDEVEVEVEESEQHPEVYRIVTPWPTAPSHQGDNYMIVDARDPEYIHIPVQVTPVHDVNDGVTWICSQSYYGLEIAETKDTKEDFLTYFGQYNISREGDIISFPAGCAMYMWPDATSAYARPGEWVSNFFAKNPGYLILPGKSAETEQWTELGKGLLHDGFFYSFINPASGIDAITTDVTIMEDSRRPGRYKVVSPFKYVMADCKDMLIDATQPDFVRILDQSTGIPAKASGEDVGEIWYYSFSNLANFPTRDAFILAGYEDLNITLENGIISIPPQAIVFYFPQVSQTVYYNNDLAVDSYIKLPEATSAPVTSADSESAEPEYYNLQGIRVMQPVKGQLLIERRGNNVRKIILK